jgi:hypothetical protein
MSSNKKRRLPFADISNSTRCTSGDGKLILFLLSTQAWYVLYLTSCYKLCSFVFTQVCTSKVSPRTTPIGPGKYVLRGRNAYRITDGNNLTSQFNAVANDDLLMECNDNREDSDIPSNLSGNPYQLSLKFVTKHSISLVTSTYFKRHFNIFCDS